MPHTPLVRRYDIDWLRTIAFGLLILYHVGMYYVADWGWHLKSVNQSVVLQDIMILTNPWRMSLLFFISGMALALVEHRYSWFKLAGKRSSRLMIPLLFGMFILVSPQPYFEALNQNLIEPGFINFWVQYINPNTPLLRDHHSVIGLLTWNHLWFLPYLWVYTLILLAVRPALNWIMGCSATQRVPFWAIVISINLCLALIWMNLRADYPPTNALIGDWYNHGKYFLAFLVGFCVAKQPHWWQQVIHFKFVFIVLAVLGYSLLILDRHGFLDLPQATYELTWVRLIIGNLLAMNHWAWIFGLVGCAGAWLNKPSPVIAYTDKAILPWYMFHQTLIICLAWWFKPWNISPYIEPILIIAMTWIGCLIGYELVKRTKISRTLFGINQPKPASS